MTFIYETAFQNQKDNPAIPMIWIIVTFYCSINSSDFLLIVSSIRSKTIETADSYINNFNRFLSNSFHLIDCKVSIETGCSQTIFCFMLNTWFIKNTPCVVFSKERLYMYLYCDLSYIGCPRFPFPLPFCWFFLIDSQTGH